MVKYVVCALYVHIAIVGDGGCIAPVGIEFLADLGNTWMIQTSNVRCEDPLLCLVREPLKIFVVSAGVEGVGLHQ